MQQQHARALGEAANMAKDEATVYIIDDEAEVRDSLARLLASADYNVTECASAGEYLLCPAAAGAACILLDVDMPGVTGPELHELLRRRGTSVPIIYLTGRSSISIGVQAMKQGALDFLEKPVDESALLAAIEGALDEHRRMLRERSRNVELSARLARLSAREYEVMRHVVAGRLNKQIAGDLSIAEKTVKVHRGRVMAKMQAKSLAELVHLCDELAATGAYTH
jgi:FixJ family two-component response regulator